MKRLLPLLLVLGSCFPSQRREDWVCLGVHGCANPPEECYLERALFEVGIPCESEGSVIYSIEVKKKDARRALALLLQIRRATRDFEPIERFRARSAIDHYAGDAAEKGREFSREGELLAAFVMFDIAVDLDPFNSDYLVERARVREKWGDREGAILDIERALLSFPDGAPGRDEIEKFLDAIRKK